MLRDCFLNVDWLTVDECQFTLCEGGTDLPGERAEHSGHYHKIGDSVVDTAGEGGAAIFGGPVSFLGFFAGFSQIFSQNFPPPPPAGVQLDRYSKQKIDKKPYHKKIVFKPLSQISVQLQHAVIASEDGRFYIHHGVDWIETQKVAAESEENGKLGRGASTIPQQLVKNLFFTTHRNPVR